MHAVVGGLFLNLKPTIFFGYHRLGHVEKMYGTAGFNRSRSTVVNIFQRLLWTSVLYAKNKPLFARQDSCLLYFVVIFARFICN